MSGAGEEDVVRARIAGHVAWSVEQRGALVMDRRDGSVTHLSNPEAAIWDLLQRPRPRAELVRLVAAITSQDEGAAEALLARTVRAFSRAGLLQGEGDG